MTKLAPQCSDRRLEMSVHQTINIYKHIIVENSNIQKKQTKNLPEND